MAEEKATMKPMKNSALGSRKGGKKQFQLRRRGIPPLNAPQDKSESLKPHSGSHKDEIKSAEEGKGRENEGLPVP